MATDWTTVIHQKDTEISVDMDSYGEEHGYPHLLIKETPKKTHANASEKTYYEKSSTPLFNCQTHAIKMSEVLTYDKHGNLISKIPGKSSFEAITPGSTNSQLESLVCQVHQMVGGQ